MATQLFRSRYRLEALLGQGGMGTVYRAQDTLLDRTVAVKLLQATGPAGPSGERLLREAKAAAKLQHPNIVTVFDAGESDGVTYIVMELVDGSSLQAAPPQSMREVVGIGFQICAALDHAHSRGIIHRDLKPENVILARDGTAKLMDFGLARSMASRVTSEGSVVGTVFYLPPEQALGQPLDGRADLYSLGVMLYELTAGRLPFVAEDPLAIISQHLHAPVVPPSTFNENIPPLLETLILSLLAKQPEERPASAAEVGRTLAHIRDGKAEPSASEALSPIDRIVRGRLIGRSQELASARSLWQRAGAGGTQVLLISGEPGVGKTRLARELVAQVLVTGGTALIGECYAEGSAPYAPMAQVIQQAFEYLGRHQHAAPESALPDLVRLAPALRSQIPNVPSVPAADAATEQQRLCDSVVALFAALSSFAPVLLVLEDAHWADGGSLSLLRHLVHRAHSPDLRLLAAVTYREVELDEARGLHDLLFELTRERLAERIKVKRLTREQTEEMLAVLFQEQITPEFLDGIYRETEGNPFFIEEVCKALIEQGKLYRRDGRWGRPPIEEMDIPQNLRMAIQARLGKLPEPARELLRAAAVIGREFDCDVLRAVADVDEDALAGSLELAEKAQLVEEVRVKERRARRSSPRYTFVHALVHHTLQESVTGLRRPRLHARVADALERLRPDELDELALGLGQYFAEAGDWEKAADYLARAGDRAQSLFAYREAVDAHRQALQVFKDRNNLERAARTLMKLGLIHHTLFEFEESRRAYQEGFALWQQVSETPLAALPTAPHAFRLATIGITTLDPSYPVTYDDTAVTTQLFRGLVERTPEMDVIPEAARVWEVLEGGRRYIFHLREDILWTDGVRTTAHDYEYGWKRALDPQSWVALPRSLFDIQGARAYHKGETPNADGVGVRAVDDLTLCVDLERPAGHFLQVLFGLLPVPRHAVESYGPAWTQPENIVTNGPFLVEAWAHGRRLVLARNPAYNGRFSGNLQRIDIELGPRLEWAEYSHKYALGEYDVAGLTPDEMDKARHRCPGEYFTAPWAGLNYLVFDASREPFHDVRVRRAFIHALDRRTLADVVLRGYPSPALGGLVPPGIPGHSPDIGLPFDPEAARTLLASAGYPGGKGFPSVKCIQPGGSDYAPASGYLQTQLREVLGVDLTFELRDTWEFTEADRQAPPQIVQNGWVADYPDPDNFLRIALGQYAELRRYREVHDLIELARNRTDLQDRVALYQRADHLLIQEAIVAPLVYGRLSVLLKPWIVRFPTSPVCADFWKDIVIEPH